MSTEYIRKTVLLELTNILQVYANLVSANKFTLHNEISSLDKIEKKMSEMSVCVILAVLWRQKSIYRSYFNPHNI